MSNNLYILKVLEDGEIFTYKYITKRIAEEHYDFEKSCYMYEYVNGKYHFVKSK